MKWTRDYDSPDVEDRRGEGPGPGGGGGLIGLFVRLVMLFGWKGGLVALGLVLVVGKLVLPSVSQQKPGHDDNRAFVGFVVDDVQKSWAEWFAAHGRQYEHAKVVLYSGAIDTACGLGQAAVGPFYCPRDEKVYLDVTFFQELHDRLGAPGDFARAYVIAHELGHHVQRLLGTTERVERAPLSQQQGAGHLSVRTELQADCYAGVWARSAERRQIVDVGDIDQAMRAAAAVGDDRLQEQASGSVAPEKWTHGSSAERDRWFHRGYASGDPADCDTFAARSLE
jgi:predicted metalloprotease